MSDGTLQHVFDYISRGWAVVPLRGKIPSIPNWPTLRLTAETAATYFPIGAENVGIITGTASGIWVLDLDGNAGLTSWAALVEEHGDVQTLTVLTGGGGKHLYFRMPNGRPISNRTKVMPGIDVRGDGGQVVAPPSIHPNGNAYLWEDPAAEVADAPLWILDLVTAPAIAPQRTLTGAGGPVGRLGGEVRCRKFLEACPDAISGQGGHNATFQAACECFRFGLDNVTAWQMLTWFNAEKCRPQWSETELRHKLESARSMVIAAGEVGRRLRESPPAPLPASAQSEPPRTDVGLAERFTARFRDDFLWVPGIGWMVWARTRYVLDDKSSVLTALMRMVRGLLTDAVRSQAPDRDEAVKFFMKSESAPRLRGAVSLAEPMMAVSICEMDRGIYDINCNNCTIDLRTGIARAHDRRDRITKLAPVEYDPAARCPQFSTFLDQIFDGNAELIGYVQRLLGMCLTGDITAQHLWFFCGSGANGKSTLLGLIGRMMGDYAGTAPDSLLTLGKDEHATQLADLQGRRIVVASETETAARLNIQRVKVLTGEETIKARRMRQDFYEFRRTHKIILQTNNRPIIREDSEAVWRRIRVVPFTVTIPPESRDPALSDKLWAEASGILNWLIAGCQGWLANGLQDPACVMAATSEYREESDPVREFVQTCCDTGRGLWEFTRNLRAAYEAYCAESGDKPVNGNIFAEALTRLGFTFERKHIGRGWTGIELKAMYATSIDHSVTA